MKQYLSLFLDKKFGMQPTILILTPLLVVPGMIGIIHPALAHENTISTRRRRFFYT
ncbi:MAG: hypothetical protein AMXMBFR60_09840 [Chloroflexota bacterium]|nr:hypothetical protein [Anaerolineales bacterium]NUQ59609.1 hypothetical protein [Anaerolineales bacterium]